MDYIDVARIEKQVEVNPSWYYHGFENTQNFRKALLHGIKASNYVLGSGVVSGLNNGPFYIRLMQNTNFPLNDQNQEEYTKIDGSFDYFNEFFFTLVLDKVKAVPCNKPRWVDDANQVFGKISPDCIIGVSCNLWSNYANEFLSNDSLNRLTTRGFKERIEHLRNIIIDLENLGKALPIYDFSRQTGNVAHEINQEEFMNLTRKL